MLTQSQVESEIERLTALLEENTHKMADAFPREARTRQDYRRKYDIAIVQEREGTVGEREARARTRCNDEAQVKESAEASARFLVEESRSIRSMLDALRSLLSAVRDQT